MKVMARDVEPEVSIEVLRARRADRRADRRRVVARALRFAQRIGLPTPAAVKYANNLTTSRGWKNVPGQPRASEMRRRMRADQDPEGCHESES